METQKEPTISALKFQPPGLPGEVGHSEGH